MHSHIWLPFGCSSVTHRLDQRVALAASQRLRVEHESHSDDCKTAAHSREQRLKSHLQRSPGRDFDFGLGSDVERPAVLLDTVT